MSSSIAVSAQTSNQAGLCKSRIVHEEKTVKGVKSTLIDSQEKYDVNGNLIDEIQYKDGKVDKHMLYEYDANNNKVKETEVDAAGKPKKSAEYKYENGLRKEKLSYDENKKLTSKKTYTYIY
jgi:antitoxin component YwqK of YwqJK toxin-antitoxin module